MHRRRMIGCLLILLALAASLLLLAGPATLFGPTKAFQFMPDLAINTYVLPEEPDPFAPGNEITYGIYVINQGSATANDVRIVVTLPEHTTYVSSSGPGFVLIEAGPDRVVWVKDHLSTFEQAWLSVTVRVDDDAPVGAGIENRMDILCLDPESDYSNNESSIHRTIRPAEPDPRVTKHLWQNSNPIAAGNEIVYEIVPENWSGSAANSVRITDTLPADCTYVSDNTADSGFTTVQTGTLVVWAKASMAPDLEQPGAGAIGNLYVHCRIDDDWTPDQWLESVVEIATIDVEYNYDNNLVRWTYKPETDRRYGAAVTSLDDKIMRLLSDAGFDYVLYYLDWSKAEPSDDQHYLGALDAAVWQAWRYNLRLVVRVDRAPAWARGPGTATAPPSDPNKLGEFLQVVAAQRPRQPGNPEQAQIYGYVIWNEPNLAAEWGENAPDAAAYTSLLQAAYNGVKAASPDAWVISAGLATTGDDPPDAVDDRTFLQAMYTAGAGSYFDYLGANSMGFASAPDDTSHPNGYNFSRAAEWRAIMEANGDGAKDMFGTETGWLRTTSINLGSDYNWMKVSEIDQAHYLARAYYKAVCEWERTDGTLWMGPMMTWNLDFAAGDYTYMEHPYWFGITDENREPLRSYLTLQNAATRGPADLWLEKELIDPIELGQDVRYVIRYTNIGGQTATGVVMTDTLPADAEYLSDTGGGTPTPAGDQVVWNIGDVYTCTYETITLTLHLSSTSPPGGLVINSVEANTLPGEPYADDNVATVITPIPGLGIYKAVTPDVAVPGQTITYTLTFGNTGQEAVTGVFITDVVPLTLTNISYARSGAVVTPTGSISYSWQVQDLAADEGGIITITGVVRPDVSGTFSLTNRAIITTTSNDPYLPDNVSVVSSLIDAEPPAPPTLVSPADGAATNDITPTLTWNASPSPDVAGYLLDFDGVVQDVGDTTQHTTGILADGAYTWTVAAYDGVGHISAYTDTWSFTVDTEPPFPPALVSPVDGAFTNTASLTLTWQSSPSPDVAGYLLDFDGVVQDVGDTAQHSTGILADGTYTWTVAAYDAASNTSAYTDTWSFTVDAPPLPPTLVSPVDGALTDTTSLTLTWQASPSPDATGYLLDLDGVVQDVGDTTQHTTGILADGVYTWTVAAYDDVGHTGTYTDTWSFTIDTTTPIPPTLVSPMDGALTNTASLTLTWQASSSPDVVGYLLDFDGMVQDVGDTAQHSTGILADGTYTWTVAAYDGVGHISAYTDTWSFAVDTQSPAIVVVSPANGATGVNIITPVIITFSRPIEASTFAFTASPDPGGWSVLWDNEERVVTLTHNPFGYWQTCHLTVTAAADPLGNPLAGAPYAWSFTTGPYRKYLPLVTRSAIPY